METTSETRKAIQPRQAVSWPIAVVYEKQLPRTCLIRSLGMIDVTYVVRGYADLADWQRSGGSREPSIMLLCVTGQKATENAIELELERVAREDRGTRVIVVSDTEDSRLVVAALQKGAKGYIGMSANLDVALAAIRLVAAGGVFVPASGLLPARSGATQAIEEVPVEGALHQSAFTPRQLAVIERLRQGESNKIIAYKLNMEECTVKVHIRNIMQKIRARNRTEIAFMTNGLFPDESR